MPLTDLPVELIASILGLLDIVSLRITSETCTRLRLIVSDPLLNPWRYPILREILTKRYPHELKHLSTLSIVPRTNWLPVLTYGSPEYILFQCTLPNLSEDQWREAFRRRFLPSWSKIKKNGSWKEAFLK